MEPLNRSSAIPHADRRSLPPSQVYLSCISQR